MAQSRKTFKKEKKQASLLYRALKGLGLTLLALFIIGGVVFGYFINKAASVTSSAQQELDRGDRSELRHQPVSPGKDNISILFLGVDDRDGNLRGRTDAIILATFNKSQGTVKMLSIPRDSRVEIAGRGTQDKINHAHAFGGVDMIVDTIENLLDIPVDYFVKLNFEAFVEIVDALGGVEIDVAFSFSESDSQDRKNAITVPEGLNTLNGEQALAYSRMRKKDPRGDIGRGERQQEVLAAIIEKTASLSSITKFDDIFDSIENHLSTNLSFGNIISLHSYSSNLRDIESLAFEGSNLMLNSVYYYSLDEESVTEISQLLKEHLDY